MSELSVKDGLSAMEVASYLRRHSDFLKEFPDLAMLLRLPREQGPAASLASYQLEMMRDKNNELTINLENKKTEYLKLKEQVDEQAYFQELQEAFKKGGIK